MDDTATLDQAQSDAGYTWQVQIGPDVQGPCGGNVFSTTAAFYVAPQGDPGQTYATCSTTAGSEWIPIPNDTPFQVAGDNYVQWQLFPPPGMAIKFLVGQAD
jgi:hypothetical protein